ncbi:MAG: hypothetical protein IPP98_10050 [Gemmatimonadetes bacterium]|nr:hypothetical protein [Gemmatimonadota bacterium]
MRHLLRTPRLFALAALLPTLATAQQRPAIDTTAWRGLQWRMLDRRTLAG